MFEYRASTSDAPTWSRISSLAIRSLAVSVDRVGVEALEADVAGQEAQEGQEHAEHGEDAGDDHLHRPFIARSDGVSITPMG